MVPCSTQEHITLMDELKTARKVNVGTFCALPLCRWFVNENCSWQAFCLTGCSLLRGHRNQRFLSTSQKPKLGPYACLRGHWWHPTPSRRGLQLGRWPNSSQREHTCSNSHTHTHAHTHCMHNTRAYGIHKAHLHAFLPTCFPCVYTQRHPHTPTPIPAHPHRVSVSFH